MVKLSQQNMFRKLTKDNEPKLPKTIDDYKLQNFLVQIITFYVGLAISPVGIIAALPLTLDGKNFLDLRTLYKNLLEDQKILELVKIEIDKKKNIARKSGNIELLNEIFPHKLALPIPSVPMDTSLKRETLQVGSDLSIESGIGI